jgi:hypothetical protein
MWSVADSLAVPEDHPEWAGRSVVRVQELSKTHEIAINPVIHPGLSLTFDAVDDLDAVVTDLEPRFLDVPRPAHFFWRARDWFATAGGEGWRPACRRIFIGAHAAVTGCSALTHDSRR